MAATNRLSSVTNEVLLPKVVDGILGSNVLPTMMLRKAAKWVGTKIKKSFKHAKSSQGSSFDGFDTFSTTATDNRITLEFDPKFYEIPVVIPLTELSINASDPNRPAELAAIEMESAMEDGADDIGTMFYGDGTGNSSKDFLGLEAIVDDGTNAATYGGQTRSSYDPLDATVTASNGSLTLSKMATLNSNSASGSVKPTLGLTTETVFNLYEQLLNPQERISKITADMKGGLTGGTGFTGLYYKGFPILADEKCTSGVLYFVNENFLEWRALPMHPLGSSPVKFRATDIEGNDYSNVTGLGFSWSGWIKPSNQGALIGHIYLGGEFWSSKPNAHGKLTGISSL